MIRIALTPKEKQDVFSLMTSKELELRRRRQGTLHKHGPKKAGKLKWIHKSYKGWIQLQRCIGGVVVALVQSKAVDGENLLLSSFIGFVDRHFARQLTSITISYESDG